MTCDPYDYRCRQCGDPLDHTLDHYTVPPNYCPGTNCEAKHTAKRERRRQRWLRFLAYLSTVPGFHANQTAEEVTIMTSLRPNTPVNRAGGETITMLKRACNGCGNALGDATPNEAQLINTGREDALPDVRGECLHCAHLVSIADVGLGDEVLYHSRQDDRWVRGTVNAIAPHDGDLSINLVDGTDAVDVKHGFGFHEWCTLDELIEYRKVANA